MISYEKALEHLKNAGCSQKVIDHNIKVSEVAVEIATGIEKKGKTVNIELVRIGALLHDIGRSKTHGIWHAVEGANIARELGLDPKIVSIIERHIGAGVSPEEAKAFGLPDRIYYPVTLEEKIVAHSDNLVKGKRRISLEERIERMKARQLSEGTIQKVIGLAEEINSY